MGDRISISFKKQMGKDWIEESPALFSHWRGLDIKAAVEEYIKDLGSTESELTPLDRKEPHTIIIDFIRWYLVRNKEETERITGDLYLGKDSNDGDNSDNGHYTYDLGLNKWV